MNEIKLLPMNLQLFAEGGEGESAGSAASEGNVVDSQITEINSQVTTPTETGVEEVDLAAQPQKDVKPVQTPEENAKYAELRRKYESDLATERQKAKDEVIASQNLEWNGKHITTEAEYKKAMAEYAEQQRIAELVEKNVPEEYAKEMVENKKFREQYESEKEASKAKAEKELQYIEFAKEYPDVKAEDIPNEVWVEFNKGKSLIDAYAKVENKLLKEKIAQYEKGAKTAEVNAKNAANSTGSVTGEGNVPTGFITKEVFEANKKDQAWMDKNYDMLMASMPKW